MKNILRSILFQLFLLLCSVGSYAQINMDWQRLGEQGLVDYSTMYTYMALDHVNDIPYLLFQDNISNDRLTVLKYVRGAWEVVGERAFSYVPGQAQLVFDSKGTPYVVYTSFSSQIRGLTVVQKYGNNGWEDVVISEYPYTGPSICFDKEDNLYLVGILDGMGPVVGKIENGQVKHIGEGSLGEVLLASDAKLTITGEGEMYMLYYDLASKLIITCLQNDNWVEVGSVDYSVGSDYAITTCPDNIVYLAHFNVTHDSKVAVHKIVSNELEIVGTPGFMTGAEMGEIKIRTDQNGVPYVLVTDKFTQYRTMVKKFVGEEWMETSKVLHRQRVGNVVTFEIDATGRMYMAYTFADRPHVMYQDGVITFIAPSYKQVAATSVYPNPNKGQFNIKNELVKEVVLYDVTGNKEQHTGLNIQTSLKGMLIAELITENGSEKVKILVE